MAEAEPALRKVYATETVRAAIATERRRPPEIAVEAAGYRATLALPAALGGTEREGTTNPEQLFGGAYAGCFAFAVEYVAGRGGADLTGLRCTAEVRVGRAADLGNELEVDLVVELPNVAQDAAEELCRKATRYCPFHRAVAGNVRATLTVEGRRDG
jgi:osmotically inducible protein OsmC